MGQPVIDDFTTCHTGLVDHDHLISIRIMEQLQEGLHFRMTTIAQRSIAAVLAATEMNSSALVGLVFHRSEGGTLMGTVA
jgi:hypothetical protein